MEAKKIETGYERRVHWIDSDPDISLLSQKAFKTKKGNPEKSPRILEEKGLSGQGP